MSNVNRVTLLGRLGKDPEIRHTADGNTVATISLATSFKSKGKEETTEWHRVVAFERLAEIIDQYVRKGNRLYVEGYLKTRKWEDKQGVEKYTTEIVAQSIQLIDKNNDAADDDEPQEERRPAAHKPAGKAASRNSMADMDDDIPFDNPYRGMKSYVV